MINSLKQLFSRMRAYLKISIVIVIMISIIMIIISSFFLIRINYNDQKSDIGKYYSFENYIQIDSQTLLTDDDVNSLNQLGCSFSSIDRKPLNYISRWSYNDMTIDNTLIGYVYSYDSEAMPAAITDYLNEDGFYLYGSYPKSSDDIVIPYSLAIAFSLSPENLVGNKLSFYDYLGELSGNYNICGIASPNDEYDLSTRYDNILIGSDSEFMQTGVRSVKRIYVDGFSNIDKIRDLIYSVYDETEITDATVLAYESYMYYAGISAFSNTVFITVGIPMVLSLQTISIIETYRLKSKLAGIDHISLLCGETKRKIRNIDFTFIVSLSFMGLIISILLGIIIFTLLKYTYLSVGVNMSVNFGIYAVISFVCFILNSFFSYFFFTRNN